MKTIKKICFVSLAYILLFSFAACGGKASTWQDQYDLGMKYLSDGKYEEAIIAFNEAIKIDARKPEAYISLAQAYMEIGDAEAAKDILEKGYNATNSKDIWELLQTSDNAELEELKNALYPEIKTLEIPLTVDQVELGKTLIELPKEYYKNYIGYYSNLMNDGTDDTVYNGFWSEEVANPLGHDENEFGFIFSAPSDGSPISYTGVNQRGLLCFGKLQIEDAAEDVLGFFHFNAEAVSGEIEWELDNGGTLKYKGDDADNFKFYYKPVIDGKTVTAGCVVKNGILYSVYINMEKQ